MEKNEECPFLKMHSNPSMQYTNTQISGTRPITTLQSKCLRLPNHDDVDSDWLVNLLYCQKKLHHQQKNGYHDCPIHPESESKAIFFGKSKHIPPVFMKFLVDYYFCPKKSDASWLLILFIFTFTMQVQHRSNKYIFQK